jgi:hypothetical protein
MDKQKKLRQLVKAHTEDEGGEDEERIMEELEDYYHVDLTSYYGEDYTSMKSSAIKKLSKKLK